MRKIDQYLLKSFVGPFAAILLIVVFILMMQFLWLYIDELVGKGLSLKVILEFLGWGCITLLPMSLPLSTLLSSMMTLGNMGENYELTAMKSAGISLTRILVPIMCASAVISIATFFIHNELIPIAYNKIYTLRDDIGHTKEEIKIPTKTFYDGIDNYILRVNDRDDKTGIMYGVMVYNHTNKNGNVDVTIADSALMKMTEAKDALTFTLFHGTNYTENNTKTRSDTTLELQTINFVEQSMVIPLENYAFQKSEETRFNDEVKSMNIRQLNHRQDSVSGLFNKTKEEQLESIRTDKSIRFNNQLDTTTNFKANVNFDISILPKKDIDEEISMREKALVNANDFVATLTAFTRENFYNTYLRRRINVEILKKFATAIACFIFFFIGAPLGALIRKGGLGTSAIISVLFFVFYWVIDITGTKLANDGAVSPAAGVFISSYILFPLGLFLTYKAINDSPLINMDKTKELIKKARNAIFGRLRKIRIVYMGTPEFAVPALSGLVNNGYNVVGVVTVADKPAGRGRKVAESPVKKYAVEHGLPVLQPLSLRDPEFLQSLQELNADIFVVVAFRMLPPEVWQMPRLGTFNLHAALLPQYRGAAPVNWAVINGDRMTGVTTFMINEGMDTGHIIFREQCRISPTDTAGDIHDKLMDIGANLVLQTVDALIDKNFQLQLQKSFIQGAEVLRPAPKITKELCHIDWRDSTKRVYNLIRGLSPHPGAFTQLVSKDGESVSMKIYAGEMVDEEGVPAMVLADSPSHNTGTKPVTGAKKGAGAGRDESRLPVPGTILSDGRTYFALTTSDGAISVTDLQISGKKRMDVRSFLAGFREPCGYRADEGGSAEILNKVAAIQG